MNCLKAMPDHSKLVHNLVQETIQTIYPNYYLKEIVDFFSQLHALDNIKQDINHQKVNLFFDEDEVIGTGTLEENHITRVFVLPKCQRKGYGQWIMQQLEQQIAKQYKKVYLDASLPATQFYEKIGYKTVKHEVWHCENHKILVYDVMEKDLDKNNLYFHNR